jgi:diguanylate cyclase (GGDEF)-like protein
MSNHAIDSGSSLLLAMIQVVLAAEALEDVRQGIAHGARIISRPDSLAVYETQISGAPEATLRSGERVDSTSEELERRLCHEAIVSGRTVSTLDRFGSEETQRLAGAYLRRYGLCLARPLVAFREKVGVLVLHYDDRIALSDPEFDTLRRFAECAAIALHNGLVRQELRDYAYTDSLTGIASRRRLDLELSRLQPIGLSLLLIDFDGLKAVNDTLGYERGDALIAGVGATLAASVREGELAARLGGDEFVVVLSHCDERRAKERCEELIEILDELRVPKDLSPLFHGASVGAATAAPGEDPRQVLRRASAEMRSRKRRRKTDRETALPEVRRLGSADG